MEEEVPVFIDGKIISFIPINLDHIKLFVKWMNNPRARKYARNVAPVIVEDIKKWFEPREGRIGRFIGFEIWHKKDKKPIGQVGLGPIDWINGWANLLFVRYEKFPKQPKEGCCGFASRG